MKNDLMYSKTIKVIRSAAMDGDAAKLLAIDRVSREAFEDGAKYLQAIIVGISKHGWTIQVIGSKSQPQFYWIG